jgi:hypothetical protein
MGVVDGFKGAGLFAKIAFGLLLVATLFAWIAYTCTGWGEATSGTNKGRHYGLWRSCSDDKYNPTCIQLDGWANGKPVNKIFHVNLFLLKIVIFVHFDIVNRLLFLNLL